MQSPTSNEMIGDEEMPKPQSEHDSKWLIVQTRLPRDEQATLDEMRRNEPDLPSRAEMLRRCFEREASRFLKKQKR